MRGIEFNDRERIVDCIMDYIDADNLKRINGEEDSEGYHPPNRGQFYTVEELAEVVGTEPLTSRPGWKVWQNSASSRATLASKAEPNPLAAA